MRIVSDYHDYYDGVQSLGQDRSLVYERYRRELSKIERLSYPEPPSTGVWLGEWHMKHGNSIVGRPFWVAVAGKIYRGYRLFQSGTYPASKDQIDHVYDAQTLDAILTERGAVSALALYHGHSRYRRWRLGEIREAPKSRVSWLGAQGTDEIRETLAARGVAVACAYLARMGGAEAPLVLNPRLADFSFYRVMDAYQAYQELAMWIGGVLASREAMTASAIASVSDADRLVKHGFDARTSFRGPARRSG